MRYGTGWAGVVGVFIGACAVLAEQSIADVQFYNEAVRDDPAVASHSRQSVIDEGHSTCSAFNSGYESVKQMVFGHIAPGVQHEYSRHELFAIWHSAGENLCPVYEDQIHDLLLPD